MDWKVGLCLSLIPTLPRSKHDYQFLISFQKYFVDMNCVRMYGRECPFQKNTDKKNLTSGGRLNDGLDFGWGHVTCGQWQSDGPARSELSPSEVESVTGVTGTGMRKASLVWLPLFSPHPTTFKKKLRHMTHFKGIYEQKTIWIGGHPT